ncbi:TonB-dependent receptor [Sphingobium sp. EM0848]|uniref:TonB-dependent receptor n=1 Tax=Sphingobium sp. EM0848 TaxID=2743473 RepID=UPI00159C6F4D|nr:TonB-dependent receptor [Sphingobium sp. EM0848]
MQSDIQVTEKRHTAGPSGQPLLDQFVQGSFFQRTHAIAGFTNLDWRINRQLTLSLGGRYSSEKKSIDYIPLAPCTDGTFSNCAVRSLSSSKHWHNFSPRMVLTWTPAEQILFFASYTQGFRSGNFNPRTNDATGIGAGPANPETVKSYELGAKTDLFERKMRLNVSLYQTDYHNIQQVLTAPGSTIIQTLLNAANARMRGIESEITIKPDAALEFNANIGYIDAKYRSFDVPVPGVSNPTTLASAKIPKWTIYLAGTYTRDLPTLDATLSLRVSYDWRSHFSTDFTNTPGLGQDAYGLTDANLTLTKGNWSASLYARNLFNVVYAETKARNFAWVAYGGQPRTYGVRFGWKM